MGILDSVGVFFESIVKSDQKSKTDINKIKKTAQINKNELDQVKEGIRKIRKLKDKNNQYSKGKNP